MGNENKQGRLRTLVAKLNTLKERKRETGRRRHREIERVERKKFIFKGKIIEKTER